MNKRSNKIVITLVCVILRVYNKETYVVEGRLTDGEVDSFFTGTNQLDDVVPRGVFDIFAVDAPYLISW
jgi:hypothetical protein